MHIHHDRSVDRNGKPHLTDQLQHGHILNDQRIRTGLVQKLQVSSGFLHIVFAEKIVYGDIYFFIQFMGHSKGFNNFFMR
ncbi:hypothetical protein D3C75_1202170 [compost metagenome]